MDLIQRNNGIVNNPRAKGMLEVIQSGDSQSGEKIADNLCHSYGVTREQAVQMAREYFKI